MNWAEGDKVVAKFGTIVEDDDIVVVDFEDEEDEDAGDEDIGVSDLDFDSDGDVKGIVETEDGAGEMVWLNDGVDRSTPGTDAEWLQVAQQVWFPAGLKQSLAVHPATRSPYSQPATPWKTFEKLLWNFQRKFHDNLNTGGRGFRPSFVNILYSNQIKSSISGTRTI